MFHAAEEGIAEVSTSNAGDGQSVGIPVGSLSETMVVKNVGEVARVEEKDGVVTVDLAVDFPQLTNDLNGRKNFIDEITGDLRSGRFVPRVLEVMGRTGTP